MKRTEAHFTLKLISHGENAEPCINAAWDELIEFIKALDESFGSACSVEFTRNMHNGNLFLKTGGSNDETE